MPPLLVNTWVTAALPVTMNVGAVEGTLSRIGTAATETEMALVVTKNAIVTGVTVVAPDATPQTVTEKGAVAATREALPPRAPLLELGTMMPPLLPLMRAAGGNHFDQLSALVCIGMGASLSFPFLSCHPWSPLSH